MRNKRPLLIYQSALDQLDFNKVNEALELFFSEMRFEQGIDIELLEENNGQGILSDPNKILDVAMVLWSHIILETLDAYMYSAAILCQADFFVTTDGALRDMTASLADQTGEYAAVAQQLRTELGLESGVRFPRGARLRQALN